MTSFTHKYLGAVCPYIYKYRDRNGLDLFRFQIETDRGMVNGKYRARPDIAKKDLDRWLLFDGQEQVYNTFKLKKS